MGGSVGSGLVHDVLSGFRRPPKPPSVAPLLSISTIFNHTPANTSAGLIGMIMGLAAGSGKTATANRGVRRVSAARSRRTATRAASVCAQGNPGLDRPLHPGVPGKDS